MRRVLILQGGPLPRAYTDRFGDFSVWFARLLLPRVAVEVVRPYQELLPPADAFDGLLLTGALESVTEPLPWMDEVGSYLLAAARSRPVLGVCFGHQLLARALGGRVERNPRGFEAGTRTVELTLAGRRDPLFAGLPPALAAQQSHEDHVPELPPGAALLATNGHSPVQAFGVGPSLRAIQFHPEIDASRSRFFAEHGRARLDREAAGGAAAVLAGIRETPEAEQVLGNWLTGFVGA